MKKLLFATGCLLLLVGCQGGSHATTARKFNAATDMVVKHSHLPIDYLIASRGTVRVNDVTTNQQLWQQDVEMHTHLRISAKGIEVNNNRVYTGTLKKGNVYEVILSRNNGL